ncbi:MULTISPECIES: hypothetical protein [unclassified Coleofasciculus]|uniref:hypothetical protein n=1 Tax=unclassified Coleofasciculus TaxID=2692782 RepID=UPI001882567A|nr:MULTISPECIES: hypothetical protein [unclassified Coleofasciculus]MBE9128020.1 hypothetical protein [Coleofasciculus sp. LEGE 07081]MBE9150540.1 hypothetical protein [Coleofasciculus sp. LEGE 07092]
MKQLQLLNGKRASYTQRDTLGVFVIVSIGLQGLVLLTAILLYGSFNRLANKPPPSLVQLNDGQTVAAAPLPNKERSPEVIKRFTKDTLTALMSWSGELPSPDGTAQNIPDDGVELKNARGKITTPAWETSFALAEDFRKEFLLKLAELTPPSIFNGTTKVVLVPLDIQTPIKIDEGKWKVVMVANLIVLSQNNLGDVIPFNKEIFLSAVEAPDYKDFTSSDETAAIIARARASGLEIYAIRDLPTNDL